MRNIALISLFLGLSAGMGAANAQAADRISVPVSGLHNDDGVVRCGLYARAEPSPKPDRRAGVYR